MTILFLSIVLFITFYILAKICDDYFVGSLEAITHKLQIPSNVAGATLMALGTSAPELFIAIIALLKPGGHAAIGVGTIIGSALFNLLIIIGIVSVVSQKVILTWQPVVRDILFYFISVVALLFVFFDGVIELYEALILVVIYVVYVFAVVHWDKILPYKEKEVDVIEEVEKKVNNKKGLLYKITYPLEKLLQLIFPSKKHFYITFGLSITFISILSWVLVESAVELSHILGIPEAIISLIILAGGTSIPDAIASITVGKKGKGDMAISNAVGSNTFDITIGLGLPWLIMLFAVDTIEVNNSGLFSSAILLLSSVVLFFFVTLFGGWKLDKKAGYLFILVYVGYVVWQVLGV